MHTQLRQQVTEFMEWFRHPILMRPATPPLLRLKLRARLIAEEAIETVEAMCTNEPYVGMTMEDLRKFLAVYHPERAPMTLFSVAKACLMAGIDMATLRILTLDQMVKVADGMADLDYVVEGTRLEYGIDGGPIAKLVHDANMTKSPAVDGHGKTQKPADFVPPDEAIGDELRRQGWSDHTPVA